MIWVVCFVAVFTFCGLPLARLARLNSSIFLAPTFGVSSIIFIGYLISAISGSAGGLSTLIAFFLMFLWSAFSILQLKHREYLRAAGRSGEITFMLVLSGMGVLFLLPSLHYGIGAFFGAVNFDYFFNSQDSLYLSTHSVLSFKYLPEADNIFPLIWSANPQGRFGISLIGAAALWIHTTPILSFNSFLLSSLILVASYAFYAYCRVFLRLSPRPALASSAIILFSAGTCQPYSYYLLGQISALPLFISSLCILPALSEQARRGKILSSEFVFSALILNALFVIYAIMMIFSALITAACIVLILIYSRASVRSALNFILSVLFLNIFIFILIRLPFLPDLIQSVKAWIIVSIKTGSATNASTVFAEYVLEPFFVLVLGMASYPTGGAIAFGWLYGFEKSVVLILAGVVGFVVLVTAAVLYSRDRMLPAANRIGLVTLVSISVSGSLAFFFTGSGYSVFKLSTWLFPLLLPLPLYMLIRATQFGRLRREAAIGGSLFVLALNIIAGFSYLVAPLDLGGKPKAINVNNVNGYRGLDGLVAALNRESGKPNILIDLKNGIRNAWIARAMPENWIVTPLSQNLQPLRDAEAPSFPCSRNTTPSDTSILVTTAVESDIFTSDDNSFATLYKNDVYSAVRWSGVDRYVFVGEGSYPPESDSRFADGERFRWVGRGVEVYYFTRTARTVDLSLNAWPGYVTGPETRNLTLTSRSGKRVSMFSKQNQKVVFDKINAHAGMNCFYIESTDKVSSLPRYGSLFRLHSQVDSRTLNFGLSSVTFK